MKKLILLTFALILVAASAGAQMEHPFIGGWNLQSITQPDGTVLTPADMGYSTQLLFQEDGTFVRYHDAAIVHEGQWTLGDVWVTYFGNLICLTILQTTDGGDWFMPVGLSFASLTLHTGAIEDPSEELYGFLGFTDTEEKTLDAVRALYR